MPSERLEPTSLPKHSHETLKVSGDSSFSCPESNWDSSDTYITLQVHRPLDALRALLDKASQLELQNVSLANCSPDLSAMQSYWNGSLLNKSDLVFEPSGCRLSQPFIKNILGLHAALTLSLEEPPRATSLLDTQDLLFKLCDSVRLSAFCYWLHHHDPELFLEPFVIAIEDSSRPLLEQLVFLKESVLADTQLIWEVHSPLFDALVALGWDRTDAITGSASKFFAFADKLQRSFNAPNGIVQQELVNQLGDPVNTDQALLTYFLDFRKFVSNMLEDVSTEIGLAFSQASGLSLSIARLSARTIFLESLPENLASIDADSLDTTTKEALQEIRDKLPAMCELWLPRLKSSIKGLKLYRSMQYENTDIAVNEDR